MLVLAASKLDKGTEASEDLATLSMATVKVCMSV